jgi:BlaI family penicillinase repressor
MNETFELSELQITLMRVLWSRTTATTAQVVQDMRQARPIAHTTVATLLTRLEKRGLVAAERQGRELSYRALVSESAVRKSMVSGLLSSLFQGQTSALLSHLLKREEIAPDDLQRMRELLDSQAGEKR